MADFWIKRNDTNPALDAILKDSDGTVIDVTGATIRFHMSTIAGVNKVDAAGSVIDGTAGHVRYEWIAADTDTAGLFNAEWEVTYSGGGIETFPSDSWFEIEIVEDLA